MGLATYIIVTPCKNEEDSLVQVAEAIANQTIKPLLWVIVDDGSTDFTPKILDDLSNKYEWIHCINLPNMGRDLGVHVSKVYREGFNYALEYCDINNIKLDFIGCIDADIILDKNYIGTLINNFNSNSRLGICSGHVGNIVDQKIVWSRFRPDLPTGGARLWRLSCFKETDGYQITCSPDSVSNVKAKIKNWDIRCFKETKAISTRPYASAQGQWTGYKKVGSNNYYIGFTPLHAFLKGIKFIISNSQYYGNTMGFAYLLGYFHDYLKRSPRIADEEVLQYYKNKGLKESICFNLKRLR
ncbi:Glycosyl transferase family 2 [Methanolobus vulcani]|uniref:Glycosyl transferase family 2 n=1 Tax=Methanolobus vulcani TaxID=38026 RepID=A0A7Z7AU71_9EURY|nr:glycosyltransferase [Methanolobus vulcani]SDF24653.1 Glycosyl transferase family 2 [Methanolobus vulcani]